MVGNIPTTSIQLAGAKSTYERYGRKDGNNRDSSGYLRISDINIYIRDIIEMERLEIVVIVEIVRVAIKSHNRLNLGNHPNRPTGGGLRVEGGFQPLTFAIITREKITI